MRGRFIVEQRGRGKGKREVVRGKVETGKRLGELLGGEVGEGVVDAFRGERGRGVRNAPVGRHVDHAGSFALGRGGEAALQVQTHLALSGEREKGDLVPRNAAALRVEDELRNLVALVGGEQKQHTKAFLRFRRRKCGIRER